MREQLLGYILGALEQSEQDEVEEQLGRDPGLRRDLDLLRRGVEPLAVDRELESPPRGLAQRTCAFVERRSEVAALHTDRVAGGEWRLVDLAVAAGVLVATSLLVFPMISQGRVNAHLAGCQNNLQQIGMALQQYSNFNDGFFPFVPPQGKLAAAGIYGPLLVEGGFLDSKYLVCPATAQSNSNSGTWPVRSADLMASSGPQLSRLQETMGGSYGYTWGYEKDDQYYGTKNQARPTFALIADAPNLRLSDIQSANHVGLGQNVLFEDGHVQFLKSCRAAGCRDDIFRNDLGIVGAGRHADDAVIAPSGSQPVLRIRIQFRIHSTQPRQSSSSSDLEERPPLVVPVDGSDG